MVVKAVQAGELDISCLAGVRVPGGVRRLVESRLGEWGVGKGADDVVLVVAELVANAVRCAPGREVRVKVGREVGGVLVAVWDSSDVMPVVRALAEADDVVPDPCALEPGHEDGGRGLPIVQALASRCGVRRTEPCGKWVWAEVPC